MPSTESDAIVPNSNTTDVVGARAGAQVIDVIITFVLVVAVAAAGAAVVRPSTESGIEGLVALSLLILSPLYGGLLEAYWNGQTVGKRLFGIKVVDRSGYGVGFGAALLRNVPAIVLFSWVTTAVALLSIATTDHRQRLFDTVADTYVVDASRSEW